MDSYGPYNITIWKTEMERNLRGFYMTDFRTEAVELVETIGVSVARAA